VRLRVESISSMTWCCFLLIVGVTISVAAASEVYQTLIPNGARVQRNGVAWPGVGHIATNGDGDRNAFGLAFAAATYTWSTQLCQADSDGDGFTNGQELGDPNCVWRVGTTPSRTTEISHPGFADSTPAGETLRPGITPRPSSVAARAPTSIWGLAFTLTALLAISLC
jgi:hypothetical protein